MDHSARWDIVVLPILGCREWYRALRHREAVYIYIIRLALHERTYSRQTKRKLTIIFDYVAGHVLARPNSQWCAFPPSSCLGQWHRQPSDGDRRWRLSRCMSATRIIINWRSALIPQSRANDRVQTHSQSCPRPRCGTALVWRLLALPLVIPLLMMTYGLMGRDPCLTAKWGRRGKRKKKGEDEVEGFFICSVLLYDDCILAGFKSNRMFLIRNVHSTRLLCRSWLVPLAILWQVGRLYS